MAGVWEKTRSSIRAEIAHTGTGMFLRNGFEQTTVDDIVAEVGISRRSFFRYFGTKEEIVLGALTERGERVAAAFAARPASEDPWTAIRNAFSDLEEDDEFYEDALPIARMLASTPSLRASMAEKHSRWVQLLVPILEARLGIASGPIPDPRAHAIVSAALACLHTATDIWVLRDGNADLRELYDEAVAAIRA